MKFKIKTNKKDGRITGKTDPILFNLLLSESIKEFILKKLVGQDRIRNQFKQENPKFSISFGFGDRYIDINNVTIRYSTNLHGYSTFGVNKNGEFFNNYLLEEEMNMILDLVKYYDESDYFDFNKYKKDMEIILTRTKKINKILND